jgi:predicted phage terminase large subunit-like protein
MANEDFAFYCEMTYHRKYSPARHTDLICKTLEAVERGELKRVMFYLPPRHSKSMTVTETFPSWFIGKNPNRRVIEISYGDKLAQKFGRENRRKIEEFGAKVFPEPMYRAKNGRDVHGVHIRQDNSSATNWSIKGHRGGMVSAGIGGAITGEGADLLVIDDPIKNRAEANSEAYRETLWLEWQNTFLTRLQAGGAVIIILTRWHEDDLAGRILAAAEPGEWTVISLPAECEDEATDLLGRKLGEPLWPEGGYDKRWIVDKKREVGSQVWASLYQQRPAPQEGDMLKRGWWRFYREIPGDISLQYQVWDCSFKDLKASDYVVGQVWGLQGANKYLLDQVRDRMDVVATMTALRTLSAKWPEAGGKYIEDKANGTAVIALLKNEIAGLIPWEPPSGKIERVQACQPDIQAGNVYLPDPIIAPWIHDFIEECAAFPNATHDDQVDGVTQSILISRQLKRNPFSIDLVKRVTNKDVKPLTFAFQSVTAVQ